MKKAEEIKERFRRLRIGEGATLQSWLGDMQKGKGEVVATEITGRHALI